MINNGYSQYYTEWMPYNKESFRKFLLDIRINAIGFLDLINSLSGKYDYFTGVYINICILEENIGYENDSVKYSIEYIANNSKKYSINVYNHMLQERHTLYDPDGKIVVVSDGDTLHERERWNRIVEPMMYIDEANIFQLKDDFKDYQTEASHFDMLKEWMEDSLLENIEFNPSQEVYSLYGN